MKKISQSHDFLDFFKLINVYRDIFLLKKILLTKDQLNWMKFLYRELDFDDHLIFSNNEIVDLIKYKYKVINSHKNHDLDKKLLELIWKEISDLL